MAYDFLEFRKSYEDYFCHFFSKETTTKFTDRMNTLIHAMIYITGIVSGIFNLTQLIDMMSIGTLLAYIIVAFCILVLRYTNYLLMLFLIRFERKKSFI